MRVAQRSKFGEYVIGLIKKAKKTHIEVYRKLGITKVFFYEIISGKVFPPAEIQFRLVEILKESLKESEKLKLFDLAAEARDDIPADIAKYLKENTEMYEAIRVAMKK